MKVVSEKIRKVFKQCDFPGLLQAYEQCISCWTMSRHIHTDHLEHQVDIDGVKLLTVDGSNKVLERGSTSGWCTEQTWGLLQPRLFLEQCVGVVSPEVKVPTPTTNPNPGYWYLTPSRAFPERPSSWSKTNVWICYILRN